jgi:hypothetical protein
MRVLSSILVCLAIASCERVVENPEWPEYKERLVCSANISIDSSDSYHTLVLCNLGKTVPLTEGFDFEATRVNDAQITLTRNSEPSIVPHVAFSRQYNYAMGLPLNSAKDYSLQCHWGSITLIGSVTIPSDVCTKLDTIITTPDPLRPNNLNTLFRMHVMPDYDYVLQLPGWLGLQFDAHDIPHEGRSVDLILSLKKGSWKYAITVANKNFRDHSSNNGVDVFGPSGGNPRHNMTGDGIGFLTYDVTGPWYPFELK